MAKTKKPVVAKGSKHSYTTPELKLAASEPVFERMLTERCGLVKAIELLQAEGVPTPGLTTIWRWLRDAENADLTIAYARTNELRAAQMGEDILAIADTPEEGETVVNKESGQFPGVDTTTQDMLGHRKLKMEARMWLAERMDSKRYGSKVTQEITGGEKPLEITDDRRAKVGELLTKLGLAKPPDVPA